MAGESNGGPRAIRIVTGIVTLVMAIIAGAALMADGRYERDDSAAAHKTEFVEHVGEFNAHRVAARAQMKLLESIDKMLGAMDTRQRAMQRDLDRMPKKRRRR